MALKVVNMTPQSLSGETNQDSEPQIAVNPQNPSEIVGSAFTPDPAGGSLAPVYVSEDGGLTWALCPIIPGGNGFTGTGDVSIRFAGSGTFYAADLRGDAFLHLNVLRGGTFFPPSAMTVVYDRPSNVDQPYIQAATSAGTDRVHVGANDGNGIPKRQSSLEQSLNAQTAPLPANFSTIVLESRATSGPGDAPSVRPAIHPDGTVYVAYLAWRAWNGVTSTTDVVICRDDNWGTGPNPYNALNDAVDGLRGNRIATGLVINWISPTLGQERIGSDLAIAVDPTDSASVYVAWADNAGGPYTLHVRHSTDRGVNWSGDIRTVTNAKNPGLAVNSDGRLGFLFQQVTGAAPNQRWVTTLELTSNDWAGPAETHVLATVPAATPAATFWPYIGDYVCLLALKSHFYGIFCANNTPDNANFPSGVSYQRNADFAAHVLLNVNNTTQVPISIDPFFFHYWPRLKWHKELKPEIKEKIEIKELKWERKEKFEIKENIKPEIDHKGLKELIKEKDKDLIEGGGKILVEGDPYRLLGKIAERIDQLEHDVGIGRAFIRPEERPDLGGNLPKEEPGTTAE